MIKFDKFIEDLKELLQNYGDGYMTFGFIIIYIVLFALSVMLLIVVYSNETFDDEIFIWLKILVLIGFYISVFLKFVNSQVNKSSTKSSRNCEYETITINPNFSNSKIISTLENDIFIEGILSDLKILNDLEVNSVEYNNLYNKIIQVGEYPINN